MKKHNAQVLPSSWMQGKVNVVHLFPSLKGIPTSLLMWMMLSNYLNLIYFLSFILISNLFRSSVCSSLDKSLLPGSHLMKFHNFLVLICIFTSKTTANQWSGVSKQTVVKQLGFGEDEDLGWRHEAESTRKSKSPRSSPLAR